MYFHHLIANKLNLVVFVTIFFHIVIYDMPGTMMTTTTQIVGTNTSYVRASIGNKTHYYPTFSIFLYSQNHLCGLRRDFANVTSDSCQIAALPRISIYSFICFNPTSHTCDFGYIKNVTQSNIQCSVIKNIYTIQCFSKTIIEMLCTMQNN